MGKEEETGRDEKKAEDVSQKRRGEKGRKQLSGNKI